MVGQPIYVKLQHSDPTAMMGVYKINVGPRQRGDPTPDLGVGVAIASADTLGESPDGSAPPPHKMARLGLPGDVVTFTHVVTNTGVRTDDVRLDVMSRSGWPLALLDLPGAPVEGTLDASGTQVISHTVSLEPQSPMSFVISTTIPLSPTAQVGFEETLSIFATSQTAEAWERQGFSDMMERDAFSDMIWVAEAVPAARLYLPAVIK